MDEGSTSKAQGIGNYAPRQPFVEFHTRDKRWAVMVCHRRAGKTVACVADLVIAALADGSGDGRYAYIAPQYNQAKDVSWLYVRQLTSDIPGMKYNETELRADFPNGSRIRLYGADNPDRLRGLYLDGCIMDEYADMKPRVWGEIVRPTLSDRGGWAAFIGTPKGKNEFWKIYSDTDDRWFQLMLRASESGFLSEAELKDAQKAMTPEQYEQEYECSFEAAITGAFYGKELAAATKEGRMTSVPYQDVLPVNTAWDLGYSDDTAIWWYQVIAGEIHVLEFYSAHGQDINHYADVIASRGYKYGIHWLPHDARAKTLASGGKSIEEMLRSRLGNIRIVPSLSLQDGIQATRSMLPRCYFDEVACAEGVEALRQYQREWDDDKRCFRDKPRHDWTSHAADAFRMMAVAWREEMQPREDEPTRFPLKGRRGLITTGSSVTIGELIEYADRKTPKRRNRI